MCYFVDLKSIDISNFASLKQKNCSDLMKQYIYIYIYVSVIPMYFVK